jgi:hypothetical protein
MFESSKKYDRLNARFISLNARFDQIVNRLDRLDVDQRSTNELAVSVNSAVDDVNTKVDENVCRIEERLAALEAASALHMDLLDGPSAEATQHRLAALEKAHTELNTAHDHNARIVARHLGLEVDEPVKPSVPTRRRSRATIAYRATEYAHRQLAAGLPVIEGADVLGRALGGMDRPTIRDAFSQLGLERVGGGRGLEPAHWVRPAELKVAA